MYQRERKNNEVCCAEKMYLQKETHILQGGLVLVRPTDYVHKHRFTYEILSLRLRVNIFNPSLRYSIEMVC